MSTLGLRFLLGALRSRSTASSRPVDVGLPSGGRLRCDVYEPSDRARGTVVSVHGMSPWAHRDPRIVNVHDTLRGLGFRVVAPRFDSIAALDLCPAQIDEVEAAVGAVASDDALCPSGRVGLFGVSFSASLCLLAASRDSVAERITGILALGGYSDVHTTIRFLLEAPRSDSYGRCIVLRNTLELAIGPNPAVRSALHEAALDNVLARPEPHLPRHLRALSADDRALVTELLSPAGSALRRVVWSEVRERLEEELAAMQVLAHVGGLRAPVTLLHGAADTVIPSDQSGQLAQGLGRLGKAHRIVVTPLLGHGDTLVGPRALASVPAVAQAFDGWIQDVAGADPWAGRGLSPSLRQPAHRSARSEASLSRQLARLRAWV